MYFLGQRKIVFECLFIIFSEGSRSLIPVHADQEIAKMLVLELVGLIANNEEQVESRHDWRCEVQVMLQGLGLVVSSENWISCSQDTRTGIQCGMHSCFGNRYSLLLHGLVDCCLILQVHFIELINTADTVIGEHQSPSLNAHIPVLVFSDTGSETGSTGGLAVGVDTPGHEFIDAFQELRLGSGGVANNQNVDMRQ